jgi:hypothetical protein
LAFSKHHNIDLSSDRDVSHEREFCVSIWPQSWTPMEHADGIGMLHLLGHKNHMFIGQRVADENNSEQMKSQQCQPYDT